MTANVSRQAYRIVGLRHHLRTPVMCPLQRMAVEAQLDAAVMLYYTAMPELNSKITPVVKNKMRGTIGLAFDPWAK